MASYVTAYRPTPGSGRRARKGEMSRAAWGYYRPTNIAPGQLGRLRPVGNTALSDLKRKLADLPISMAHQVAREATTELTRLTKAAFFSYRNVYGESRENRYPSATGKPLTLIREGKTRDTLAFTVSGTIVRCVMAEEYMRYLIGKYGVLPNGHMPDSWARSLSLIVDRVGARL
jgi:hypothetical protein